MDIRGPEVQDNGPYDVAEISVHGTKYTARTNIELGRLKHKENHSY